jgi:hypothetical protein
VPEDSPFQESATSGKGEGRFYVMKSIAAMKTAKKFWWPKTFGQSAMSYFYTYLGCTR